MAPGSHPRHTQPDIAIQMLLKILSDKGPYLKRCMKSGPKKSFCQVHQRRPLDNDQVLHGFFPSGPRPPRSMKIILILPASFVS